jgi:hypothetical protein
MPVLVAIFVLVSAGVASAQQNYEITRPYGDRGPAYITGPNGYQGTLTRPYGSRGPSYYSDNLNRQPNLNPLLRPRPGCEQPWQSLSCDGHPHP